MEGHDHLQALTAHPSTVCQRYHPFSECRMSTPSFQPRLYFFVISVADHSSPWVWLTLGTHRASLAQVQPHTPLRLQIQGSNHTRPQLFLDLDPCSKCPWMKSFSLSFPSPLITSGSSDQVKQIGEFFLS